MQMLDVKKQKFLSSYNYMYVSTSEVTKKLQLKCKTIQIMSTKSLHFITNEQQPTKINYTHVK